MFTGADIRISKSSILYNYNLCTSVAVKSQARANSMLVSLQQHHFVGKWNTDPQIKKGDSITLCKTTIWVKIHSLVNFHQHW